MKEWFTASELAKAKLPGLPESDRNIRDTAKREGWKSQPHKGHGGGLEYHISSLSILAQTKLVVDSAPTEPAPAPQQAERSGAWAAFEALPEVRKEKARAKLAVLNDVEVLRLNGMPVDLVVSQVARERGIGASTIHLWRAKVAGISKADWLPMLVDHYAGRTATVECHPDAWDMLKSDYLRPERRAFSDCYRDVQRASGVQGWSLPSERTLFRRLNATVPAPVIVLAREGVEAAKAMFPAQERDRSIFHALEAVNADGHRWDVWVEWPDGTVARPCMVGFQDLYSGKILSWRVDQTENSWMVRLAIGDLVENYGIPTKCWLDNGRGFASKWLTGGIPNRYRFKVREDEPTGILTQLGVKIHWTTPYSGQSKPIERAWRDLSNTVARHPAFAGAWTGNNPLAKPENYRSKAIPLDRFLEVLASEIREHNARTGRQATVCRGVLSFDEAFDASYRQSQIIRATDEQRRLWLLAAEGITASSRDGSIRLMDNRYWAEFMHTVRGEKIAAMFDPDALWDGVHVYRLDGGYLGFAPCLEAVGFESADAAREHGRQRKRWLRAQKDMLDAERRMSAAQVASLIPLNPGSEPPEARVVALARPVHDLKQAPRMELPTDFEGKREAMIHEFRAPAAPSMMDEKRARFARAQGILGLLAAGTDVPDEDAAWVARYQQSAEYRAFAGTMGIELA